MTLGPTPTTVQPWPIAAERCDGLDRDAIYEAFSHTGRLRVLDEVTRTSRAFPRSR